MFLMEIDQGVTGNCVAHYVLIGACNGDFPNQSAPSGRLVIQLFSNN
jgi:hypothetical protein